MSVEINCQNGYLKFGMVTTKISQTSIEINGKLKLSQIWDAETFESLHTISNGKMIIFKTKISHAFTLLLFVIYSSPNLKYK